MLEASDLRVNPALNAKDWNNDRRNWNALKKWSSLNRELNVWTYFKLYFVKILLFKLVLDNKIYCYSIMDKHNSSELLSSDFSLSKNASSDSLDSDSKSSSLNSKHGQDSVSFLKRLIYSYWILLQAVISCSFNSVLV